MSTLRVITAASLLVSLCAAGWTGPSVQSGVPPLEREVTLNLLFHIDLLADVLAEVSGLNVIVEQRRSGGEQQSRALVCEFEDVPHSRVVSGICDQVVGHSWALIEEQGSGWIAIFPSDPAETLLSRPWVTDDASHVTIEQVIQSAAPSGELILGLPTDPAFLGPGLMTRDPDSGEYHPSEPEVQEWLQRSVDLSDRTGVPLREALVAAAVRARVPDPIIRCRWHRDQQSVVLRPRLRGTVELLQQLPPGPSEEERRERRQRVMRAHRASPEAFRQMHGQTLTVEEHDALVDRVLQSQSTE